MNASQDLQSDVGASRVTGLWGRRLAAAVLAAVAAGLLAQPAPAQTRFPLTIDLTPAVPVTMTVPDPLALAEQALQCDLSASCVEDLLQAAAPAPPSPSPAPRSPAPSEPSGGGEPAAPPPEDDARASPAPPAAKPARPPREPAPVSGPMAPASRPQLGSTLPREAPAPPPALDVPPRGPELLAPSEPGPLLPATLSGLDWSPFLLNVLLAAGSLAFLLFVLTATPQHSAGQVSYWLADRRSDLALLATVMLVGLAVGYFIATSLG